MVLSPKGPNIYEKKKHYPLFSNISTAFLKLSILHYKKTANGIYHLYFIKISDIVSYTSIYKLLFLVFFSFFFFFAVLGLGCCTWTFSSCSEQGLLSRCDKWASHCSGFFCHGVWVPGLSGSIVVMNGLSCPAACGIPPDQGLNQCFRHCKVDS